MNDLVTMMENLPANSKGDVGATFFRLPPGLTFAEWQKAAQRVASVGYGYWWWIADLAQYAMHNFEKKDAKRAVDELSKAIGCRRSRVYGLALIGRAYPVRERVRDISITHHRAVMHLEKGRRGILLRMAARRGWPVRILIERSTPKAERMMTVVLKVPALAAKAKKFDKAIAAFAEDWAGHYWVWGNKFPRKSRPQLSASG